MSRNKLQAIQDAVAEILSEPPSSPRTYFDDEPHDAAQASEGATAADSLQRATQIPTGKATSGEPGISLNERAKEQLVHDAENESSGMVLQALAEKIRATPPEGMGRQHLFRPSDIPANLPLNRQTSSTNTLCP